MEVGGARPGRGVLRRPLKALVTLAFADLAALMVVVYAHVVTSDGALVIPAEALGVALALLAGAALVMGVAHAWLAYPDHRRPVAFIVAVTLATLLAHAYVIGTPAASAPGSVSGQAGSSFGDERLTADSSVANSTLTITLTAHGDNAIAQANVTAGGVPLQGSWAGGEPSFASPLQPGTSTTGSWLLPPTASQESVNVSYRYLTCYDTGHRFYGCIMDEIFYVPEGMGVLAGQHCGTGAGTPSDCHLEHPPLVPVLMAAGMAAFGEYNAAGWRVMPALLGSFSIPLLFGVAWKASGSRKLAYLSATLLALDVMFFSQSSGALLDVPEVFFDLAAFFVYFAGLRVWKLDRYVLAGVLLGVAGLAKETAIFAALAFVTYVLLFGEGDRKSRVRSVVKVALTVGLVFSAGLQAYDSAMASPQYSTFVQHVGYILSYGSSLIADKLACQPATGYWCRFPNSPGGSPILPMDWLTYYSPVTYFAPPAICASMVNGVCQGGTYVPVAYYGVTNLLETWTVYVWVPLVAYALYRWYRRPKAGAPAQPAEPAGPTGDVRFAGLTLTLFLWTYVPYLFLFLAGRVTYPFYFIPAIPAVAMGASYWLSREWFPKKLMAVYIAMVFVFFLVYFPDKAFLPVWLRVLVGH